MIIPTTIRLVIHKLHVLGDGMAVFTASRRGPVIALISKGGVSIAIDDIVEKLIMRPHSYAFPDAQERVVDTDIIADNEMIPDLPIGVPRIGSHADAMFFIAEHQIIAHHRRSGRMPQINATTSIIVGD